MNRIIFILFSFLSVITSAQEVITFQKVCQRDTCTVYTNGRDLTKSKVKFEGSLPVKYISDNFHKPSCADNDECYLFLGATADTYSVTINDQIITNLISNERSYSTHNSVVIPIPRSLLKDEQNSFTIEVSVGTIK